MIRISEAKLHGVSNSLRPWELSRKGTEAYSYGSVTDQRILAQDERSHFSLPPQMELSLDSLQATIRESEAQPPHEPDLEGRTLLALTLMGHQRFIEARETLNPLIERGASGRIQLLAAVASDAAGENEACALSVDKLERIEAALERDSDAAGALWMSLGTLFLQCNALHRARACFDRASSAYQGAKDTDGVVWALKDAAVVTAGLDRVDEARTLLKQAKRLCQPTDLRLLIDLEDARCLALKEQWEVAQSILNTALEAAASTLWPGHPLIDHILVSLAAVRMERGLKGEETQALLDRAFGTRAARSNETAPEVVEVLLLIGELHRLNGRVSQALPLLARAALAREHNGESPEAAAHAYAVWAEALQAQGLDKAAKEKSDRARALINPLTKRK